MKCKNTIESSKASANHIFTVYLLKKNIFQAFSTKKAECYIHSCILAWIKTVECVEVLDDLES